MVKTTEPQRPDHGTIGKFARRRDHPMSTHAPKRWPGQGCWRHPYHLLVAGFQKGWIPPPEQAYRLFFTGAGMAKCEHWQGIPTELNLERFREFVLPHLSVGSRG